MQKLMMLGASERHVPFIKKATDMGLFTICVDQDKDAPGFEFAYEPVVASICREEERVLNLVKRLVGRIDACISIPDIGLRTSAFINTALNLRGLKLHTYNIVTNKHFARVHYNDAGVLTPRAYMGDKNAFPIIVKPHNSTGSQGVIKLYSYDEYTHFMSTCRNFNFVAEEYVVGDNVTVDLIMQNGKVRQYLIQDRYLEHKNCFVDSIIISPSKYYRRVPPLFEIAERACKAVGLIDGPANVQFIVDANNKAYLIEINPRISGPYGIECHSYATGRDWFEDITQVALNISTSTPPSNETITPNACITIGSEKAGKITGWTYSVDEIYAHKTWYWKHIGDHVDKFKAVKDSVKHIFIMGDDIETIKTYAYRILKESKIKVGGI